MDFLKEVVDVGRRATVDALQSSQIDEDSPFSPEVPEELRSFMPDLFDRFPLVFPWNKAEPVDPALHTVWLLDNTAFRTPQPGDKRPDLADLVTEKAAQPARISEDGSKPQPVRGGSGWEVEFVACYFVKNSGRDLSRVVGHIAHEMQISDEDVATKKRIAERVQPFVDTILPKRTVRIAIDDKEQQTLGPSSYSGISSGLHQLHFDPGLEPFTSNTLTLPPPFSIPSTTIAASEHGWGIISDIDDTIKITNTPSPLGVLHSTFIEETPDPVPGMPALYAHLQRTLSSPPFFYLSASPYNLYPFLHNFRDAHYPPGTIILRDASWQNLGGLIASLQQNPQEYKVDRMRKLHAWFPHRRFICIGDSTQKDPESYGEVARRWPGWVKGIFIRRVSGVEGMDERKNEKGRFEEAFKGLERGLWHVFDEAAEVGERVEELVREERG
ncbi:hypothetical protein M409DRAFT_20187 [Zasmidium cellare ATCC 36951]|uniref:Phosphatidate phosphatase APP1 catalytic domain-containing protein n=1 Tax=Zasmidium cellare ATCC 36951 TaxID=1080233 RepID=A0A6A6CSU6_ZASCE|nr:uncharacterized protein M409DRAFT_20187 [Zasmidium cellare ATCC 36951]KAF2169773.1 hypothetical protein M409DRAFT_20187 [Zasmidium cellare ATCC 36951]